MHPTGIVFLLLKKKKNHSNTLNSKTRGTDLLPRSQYFVRRNNRREFGLTTAVFRKLARMNFYLNSVPIH